MRGLVTVLRKEIKENLRDRRALINSLLLGPILFPAMFMALMWFTSSAQQERAEKTLEVPVIGAEHAPSLMRFLEQQGMVIKPAPENPEELVRSQEEFVILRLTEEYPQKWNRGEPAPVEVIADLSRQESELSVLRVKRLLSAYGQQIGVLRLHLRGVAPQATQAVTIHDVDLSTPKSRAILAMIFLPYILMITAFTGGMHIALDTTAGEKERKSLEPLLINPVPRWQIMSGKLLTTMIFAMVSLFLTLVTFKLAFRFVPMASIGVDLSITATNMMLILLVIVPVAILAASLLTLLAAYAKTYREAQSSMSLVILIPLIPSLIFMSNPVRPDTWMMTIPLFSQNLLIGEIMRDEMINPTWFLLSIACTLVVGLSMAAVAATLYNKPRLIFSGS